ncbi:hypothetical protein Tco_0329093 [Tanacetum coccineum]
MSTQRGRVLLLLRLLTNPAVMNVTIVVSDGKITIKNGTKSKRRGLEYWLICVLGRKYILTAPYYDVSGLALFSIFSDDAEKIIGGNTIYTDHIDLRLGGNIWEMITSQLQEKLWLYDEVRTRTCGNTIYTDHIDLRFDENIFNTIITSLKALDEGYFSKNYVRKFLRALHPKRRAKVMTIEESKDLTSLSLDELIWNLKVYEMIIKKDSKIVKPKGERKSLALKAKKESSNEESSTSESEDEEYAMAVRDFKKFFKRRGRCGDPNYLIGECPKPPKDMNQKAFVGGSWSDRGEEDDEKAKDETCLMAHAFSEMEKEDSVMNTTSLVDNFDKFITQLNSDGHATTSSFAAMLRNKTTKKIMKATELRNDECVEGVVVAIPLEAVKEVSSCFDNTLYGYFVGKRLAFPLVENHVKNTWHKFGLERVMYKNDFFFFQFTTRVGMERVLENGPWLIRSVPLILNIWTPNAKVAKEEVKTVPVWVKLHHVPVVAYSEIGLSLITTQLGKLIMLDSYTCSMCLNPWGKNAYARALIEVSATSELLNSVVVAIPFLDGTWHSLETVDVEYEWTPPRCSTCCIFDHVDDLCSKKPEEVITKQGDMDEKGVTSNANVTNDDSTKPPTLKKPTPKEVVLNNSFTALIEDDASVWSDETTWLHAKKTLNVINESDSEEVDQTIKLEKPHRNDEAITEGASTPVTLIAILESHVASSQLDLLCSRVFHHWSWTSNSLWCSKGTRIILGWDSNMTDVSVISQTDQAMHVRVWIKLDKKELFCSFVYAHNSMAGSFRVDISMREFKECVEETEVMDVARSGLRFTWNQKPRGADGILKKIDHVVRKLKCLKKPLRKLLYEHGNLHNNVKQLRIELDQVQRDLDLDPFNSTLREEEAIYVHAFKDAVVMEERFMKQKAKVEWLKVGDSNTAYFHKAVKSRISRSRIDVVMDSNGTLFANDHVADAFVNHYENFLEQPGSTGVLNTEGLFLNTLDDAVSLNMVRPISAQEVKEAMFSMGNDKSPGPDGFTAAFFKET